MGNEDSVPMQSNAPPIQSLPIKEMLSTENLIFKFKQAISGKMIFVDKDGEVREVKVGAPLVNAVGVEDLVTVALMNTGMHVHMANISEKYFSTLLRHKYHVLRRHLKMNWKKYDIHPENIPVIFDALWSLVFFSLSRGLNAGEKKFLENVFNTTYITENREMPSMGQQQRGFMGGLSGFLKGR